MFLASFIIEGKNCYNLQGCFGSGRDPQLTSVKYWQDADAESNKYGYEHSRDRGTPPRDVLEQSKYLAQLSACGYKSSEDEQTGETVFMADEPRKAERTI